MRKNLFLALAAMLLPVSLDAQIRDYVPIVRPKYNDETAAFLRKLGDSLERDGYYDAAEALNRYTAGCFGSGFVYVGPDGTNYVVTNLHVVSQAASVTVEFQSKDGEKTLHENCSILTIDEKLDLALIAFPPGAHPLKQGLSLSSSELDDGAEVWSAGYPGLGGSPSWQLGKGNVTNSAVRIPEVADPESTYIIQHSAPVDPGNSGGPLLVIDRASPAGYAVVGINTAKAYRRQAANFSVPTKAILGFVERTLHADKARVDQGVVLEARCRAFAQTATGKTEAYEELAAYISYAYVGVVGESVLKDVLSTAPTKVRDNIMSVFAGSSPIEGIRLAIAYAILSGLPQDASMAISFLALDGDAEAPETRVPVRFSRNGEEIATAWVREQGVWRLTGYSGLGKKEETAEKKSKAGETGDALDARHSPYYLLVTGGAQLLSGDSLFWSLGLDYVPDIYFSYGFEVAFLTSVDAQIGVDLRVQYPITQRRFSMVPYAGVLGGLFLYYDVMDYPKYIAPEAGIRLGYDSFYFTASYRYFFTNLLIFSGSSISLTIGYGI